MRHALLVPVAVLALFLTLPAAHAQDGDGVQRSVVILHDLYRDGAYVGCHVANPALADYRLTVTQGARVVLDVQANPENENAHTLTVERYAQATRPLAPGERTEVSFVADQAGSFALLCDDRPDQYQGLLRVQAAMSEPNESPGTGAFAALVAGLAAAVALARRR